MHVHPDIAALRSDRASQRREQASINQVVADWQAAPQSRRVGRDLAAFGAGSEMSDCDDLSEVLHSPDAAREWLEPLLGAILTTLRENPLLEVPLNAQSSESFAALRLMTAGKATLRLCAYWPSAEMREITCAVFTDHQSHELVLKGEAEGAVFSVDQHAAKATIQSKPCLWRKGEIIALDYMHTRSLTPIGKPVLTLQIARTPTRAEPSHQYRIETGERIHSASGDKQTSRLQMAVAVLGALKHGPATPELERLASDKSADPDLRWEAVRQCLALDPADGFSLLSKLAEDGADPLAGPASTLRRTLVSTYPQLAKQAA